MVMKKKKTNIGMIIVAILASVLLLYWLFAATLINEDENAETVPELMEQTN